MATPYGLAKANIDDIFKNCQQKLKANWKACPRDDEGMSLNKVLPCNKASLVSIFLARLSHRALIHYLN